MSNKTPMDKLLEANPDAEQVTDPWRATISTDGLLFLTFKKETITKLMAASETSETGEVMIVVNTTKLLAH